MQGTKPVSRFSRRRLIGYTGVTGAGLLGAALIGCSSKGKPSGGTGAAVGSPVGTPVASAAQPKMGGVFRTTVPAEPGNLDVFLEGSSNVISNFGTPVFSQMVRWKVGPGVVPVSVLEGDVAQSWETPDGKTWTFKLRDNVKFHPKPPINGRALDSEDVKTSIDRLIKVSAARQTLTDLVDRVETPDKGTVIFRLKEVYPPFAEVLSGPLLLYIFTKEANAGSIPTQKIEGAIGSGPWMWKEKTSAVAWEFERHPSWHIKDAQGRQLPYMAGWRVSIIPEYAQTLAQFASGQLSTMVPNTEDAEGLLQRVPKAQIVPQRIEASLPNFAFHQQTPTNVMRDVRLRRAWSMAIDRMSLLETFGQFEKAKKLGYKLDGGIGNPPIPYGVGMEYWYLDPYGPKMGPSGQWFQFNAAEAKKLVQAAGYDGQKIGIKTPGVTFIPTLEAHIPMLKAAGFNPAIESMEFSQYVAGPYNGKGPYQASYGGMAGWPTVDEYCYNLLMPGGYRNQPAVDDSVPGAPKVFELIRKQRTETNKEARQALVYDIQRLAADQMWFAPTMHGRWGTLAFAQPPVRNFGQYIGAPYTLGPATYAYYWLDA